MGKRWTAADIAKLRPGMAPASPAPKKPARKKPAAKAPADEPTGLQHIKGVLDRLAIPYDTEYRFHPVRRFRFDVAI